MLAGLSAGPRAEEVTVQGLQFAVPPGWERTPETPSDPDLVCELTRGEAEILVYLEQAEGRSLEGLWVALRYSVVIDWGGSILRAGASTLDGVASRWVEFQAKPEGSTSSRRFLRALSVREDRKLTVQVSAPAAGFDQGRAGLQVLFSTLRWRLPSSSERA